MKPHNTPAAGFLLYPADEPYLDRLVPGARRMLEMATNDGTKYEVIAELTQTPIGTVKSGISRSREKVLKMRAQAAASASQRG